MLVVAVGMEKETASVGGDGWKEGGMEVHMENDVKDDVRVCTMRTGGRNDVKDVRAHYEDRRKLVWVWVRGGGKGGRRSRTTIVQYGSGTT